MIRIQLACRSLALCFVLAMLTALAGCDKSNKPDEASGEKQPAVPLRILVLDDEELATVVQQEWESRGGLSQVTRQTSAEWLASEPKRLAADVIIYPSGLLGELAERNFIVPLDDETLDSPGFDRSGLFDLIRLREIAWGNDVMAVPFGSPPLTLFYRRDIFQKLQLTPPATWQEYQTLAERLADRESLGELAPPQDQPWHATVEPTAGDWASYLLLSRAAAYCRHPNQYSTLFDFGSMQPLIDSPPFVRALEELTAAAQHSAPGHTPTEARRIFLAGQSAMALTWPSRADDASPETSSEREDWIGIAELPGAREAFSQRADSWEELQENDSGRSTLLAAAGRLGSVTRDCRQKKQAVALLLLLTGRELGATVGAQSKFTTLTRIDQLTSASAWTDRELAGEPARMYGEAVQATLSRPYWIDAIRLPGRSKYLAALNSAIEQTLADEATPSAALTTTASQWSAISESLGLESQRQAYVRNLGLKP
jgi:multiple sugar transport system substrate-binding protein